MLSGERVGLRARQESDMAVLHAELHDDIPTRVRANGRPWRPVAPGPDSPYAVVDQGEGFDRFAVVELSTGELAGDASVWGLDPHNRLAHLGLSLRPAFRGRGLGTDVLRVLCEYGFRVRGLRRLQVDTLADNEAMIKAAVAVGFTVEGTLRQAAWVYGDILDEVVLGLLADEWRAIA
jgi:RimJ/RimL family protein N-acetyltransferase